jgi:hypothetical protein
MNPTHVPPQHYTGTRLLPTWVSQLFLQHDDVLRSLYSTYLVSAPIVAYYYTQIVGDAKQPPTLLASANFNGMAVIGGSLPFTLQ